MLHEKMSSFTPSQWLKSGAEAIVDYEPADASATLLQTPIFSGYVLFKEVQPGLTVTADELEYLSCQEFTLTVSPSVTCSILLDGDADRMTVGDRQPVSKQLHAPVVVGYGENQLCRWSSVRGRKSASVGIVITKRFFDRFSDDISENGLSVFKRFMQEAFCLQNLPRNPLLLDQARSILHHPYNGSLADLFLESKTLFMVAELARQLEQEPEARETITSKQYEQVLHARDILDKNLISPPRTLELARQCGVNITTLQANFKAVFDTTIFGYVGTRRLMMAKILLQNNDLTVSQVAYKVGFANPSAFAAAYKRQFGCSPTADRTGKLS